MASITSGVVSFSSPGNCVIDANQSGNSNYAAAPQVQQVIIVAKESQTISITSTAPSETYGSTTNYTPAATATSTLSVTFTIDASSTTGTCSIASGVVSFSSPGTCIIDANQSGNSDYAPAPQLQQVPAAEKDTTPPEIEHVPGVEVASIVKVTLSVEVAVAAGV